MEEAKMNTIKPLAAVLTYLLCSNIAFASTQSERVYLHDQKYAKSEYEKYKADKANNIDPFEKIREGYNSDLSKDIEQTLDRNKARSLSELLESQNESITEKLTNNSAARQEEKARLYNLYHTEGYFNSRMYNTKMDQFNRSIASGADETLRSRTTEMESLVSETNTELQGATTNSYSNSKQAASNLISLINSENLEAQSEVESTFNSSQARLAVNSTIASNAVRAANQWNEECGSACDLPTPPPPPATEPEPEDPWKDVETLCWTKNGYYDHLDKSSTNSCELHIRDKVAEPIQYSIGEIRNATTYSFKNPSDWSASWSGDCVSTNLMCTEPVMRVENDNRRERVNVTLTYTPTGESRTYSLVADIEGVNL